MDYTIQTVVAGEFDDVVAATESALDAAGFGVLCDIDVRATFAEKLDEDFRQYRILGACSPSHAHQALTEEVALGALLPCNVVLWETDDGDVVVAAVDPARLVGLTDNEALAEVADSIRERFEQVLAAVTEEFEPASPDGFAE